MRIICTNKKCQYEWNYRGDALFYTTCPKCMYKVNIEKARDALKTKLIEEKQTK